MSTARTLPEELSIYTVGEVRAQCLVWIGEPAAEGDTASGAWPLDAHAVDQVDAAGVQLLVSLSHTLSRQDQRLHLLQPSGPLTEACAALGLAGWLSACTAEGAAA